MKQCEVARVLALSPFTSLRWHNILDVVMYQLSAHTLYHPNMYTSKHLLLAKGALPVTTKAGVLYLSEPHDW